MSHIEYEYVEPAKLKTQINSARRVTFFVHANQFLYTRLPAGEGEGEERVPGRGYEYPTMLRVTAAVAMGMCSDLAGFAERKGEAVKMRVGKGDSCWFIG